MHRDTVTRSRGPLLCHSSTTITSCCSMIIKIQLIWAFICHIHNYTQYNQQWNVFSAFNPSKCTHTWSSGQPTLRHPVSSWGFGALLRGLTSVVDNSCRSWDSNPQPRITSPTLYPLGHDCPNALPHDLNTIPGSWKHPSSCMASILTGYVTHWACLGCSGSAYMTACSSSCQYLATSHSHWRGEDIPQATFNNLINSMRRRCVALREANGGHTRYWLVFGTPTPPQIQ